MSTGDRPSGQRPDHYDEVAERYAAQNDTGLFNAWYARPAILDLAGDVGGRRVLDAGCGHGPLMEALAARGATVAGFDASPAMVDLARQRLGPGPDLRVADLARPLPYPDAAFDDVVCSLVLHYLEDWSGPLAELRRVLRPGGRVLLCVNHPMIRPIVAPDEDYFAVAPYTEDYDFDGVSVDLTFWHRPLHAMTDAFTEAGLRVSVLSEPPFSPKTPRELLPAELGDRSAFICFLFFVLEAA